MMSIKISEGAIKRGFGKRVRKLRKSNGLSQEKLAFETGMDLTSINEIEMGRRSPTLVTICKIAKALKVNGGQLLPF